MKGFFKTYIPAASVTFTVSALAVCVVNLTEGFTSLRTSWCLELFGLIFLIDVTDYLLSKINFKNYALYYLTELLLTYMIMLGIGYLGSWFVFEAAELIKITLLYLVIFSLVHGYFYRRAKKNAREINGYLKKGDE